MTSGCATCCNDRPNPWCTSGRLEKHVALLAHRLRGLPAKTDRSAGVGRVSSRIAAGGRKRDENHVKVRILTVSARAGRARNRYSRKEQTWFRNNLERIRHGSHHTADEGIHREQPRLDHHRLQGRRTGPRPEDVSVRSGRHAHRLP